MITSKVFSLAAISLIFQRLKTIKGNSGKFLVTQGRFLDLKSGNPVYFRIILQENKNKYKLIPKAKKLGLALKS